MSIKKKRIIYGSITVSIIAFILLWVYGYFCVRSYYAKSSDVKSYNLIGDIGQESFPKSNPEILYGDEKRCIFYDSHGVFVYDLKMQRFSDYIEYKKFGLTKKEQGGGQIKLAARMDGTRVYIEGKKTFLDYDCVLHKYDKTGSTGYDMNYVPSSLPGIQENVNENAFGPSYVVNDGMQMYWEVGKSKYCYADLLLVVKKNGEISKYSVFAKK
jgi:hypothetical protein